MMRRLVLIFALASLPCWSQPTQQPAQRVQVMVDGDDQGAMLIKSYANRELRALGDVVVENGVPASPHASTEYRLAFVVLPTTGGYAISVVVEELNTTERVLRGLLEYNKVKPEIVEIAVSALVASSIIRGHWLRTCQSSALEAGIKAVVAKFDVEYLQPSRDFWQLHMNPPKTPKQN